MKKSVLVALILLIIGILVAIYAVGMNKTENPSVSMNLLGSANYICTDNKTITAQYYEGPSDPQANSPKPNGRVDLALSDGRSISLPQTLSASGVRFADANEATVFWNKGNGVTFTENGEQSYMGCMLIKPGSALLPNIYGNGSKGMTVNYPNGFTIDENYSYQALGPGKGISGVKFTIPASVATGTNLSKDTYISIEQIPNATSCTADLFLDRGTSGAPYTITDNGATYSFASSTGAAAGNRYEENVYAMPGTNPCVAVRYYIHSGAISNYPSGTKEFDMESVKFIFDQIRNSITVLQ